MNNTIYVKLQEKLDLLENGFPKTGGSEIEFLHQLFSQEQAEVAVAMDTEEWESIEVIAKKMGRTINEIQEIIDGMVAAGLIYRVKKGTETKYHIMALVLGMFSAQVNKMDKTLLGKFAKFASDGYGKTIWGNKVPLMRFLPVDKSVIAGNVIIPVDDAHSIIDRQERISLGVCLCRQKGEVAGNPCKHTNHPIETCMQFNDWADFFVSNGDARYITKEEAHKVMNRNDKEGLMNLVNNTQDVEFMCSCCSCCCGALRPLHGFGGIAEFAHNYDCKHDDSLCISCGACVGRCKGFALTMQEGKVKYNQEKCLGCGLCVNVCLQHANILELKPEDKQLSKLGPQPKDMVDLFKVTAQTRKK